MSKVTVNSRKVQAEKSKQKILQATLEVLATKGIKGTTHRAVAKHANIQLSLITYYFKDINMLIREAFTLRIEQAIVNVHEIWQQVFTITDEIPKQALRKTQVREDLCLTLSTLASHYLLEQIHNSPVGLAVEQVLLTEAQFSPELKSIAEKHKNALLQPIVKFCQLFNRQSADIDAQILLIMFTQIEYQQLGNESIDLSSIEPMLRRVLGNAMGLKHF